MIHTATDYLVRLSNYMSHPAQVVDDLSNAATLENAGKVVTGAALVVKTRELFKEGSLQKSLKEQKAEEKEDARILGMMRSQGDEIRSSSPKTCVAIREIADRAIHKMELHPGTTDTVLVYHKLYAETVAQCSKKCR